MEVLRDASDTTIAICGMENLDPMGVHTGDSIVVAPIQTLPDPVVQRLRRCALKIVRALKLEGGCNVQLAVSPDGSDYRVIEVNPRVSRSSALASKATGYPIARIAALIALGPSPHEMPNPATGGNSAAFEPAVDYVVVKLPRWPFDKFPTADRSLGVQMKATGEAMAIDREFGSALLKAIRSLEPRGRGWLWEDPTWELTHRRPVDLEAFLAPSDTRLWRIVGLMRHGWADAPAISTATGIAPWFTDRIAEVVAAEASVVGAPLIEAKRTGFGDADIATLSGVPPAAIRRARARAGIGPAYRRVDTCAGEFPAETPYFYPSYAEAEVAPPAERRSVIVVGSGPIRIGQGIEFDYCSGPGGVGDPRDGARRGRRQQQPGDGEDRLRRLHAPLLRAARYRVRARRHRPRARPDRDAAGGGAHVRGPDGDRPGEGPRLCRCPDRRPHRRGHRGHRGPGAVRRPAHRARPRWAAWIARADATGLDAPSRPRRAAGHRPSIVGYRRPGIAVLRADADVVRYLATDVGWPLRVDELVAGTELDVDAISDGTGWSVPGILEQVDPPGCTRATASRSSRRSALSRPMQERAAEAAGRIALALGVRGILNVQMIATADRIVVIEANPRASRTVPIVAKATGIDVVAAAVRWRSARRWWTSGSPRGSPPMVRSSRSRRRSGRSGASRASLRSSGPRCARRARCSAWRRRPTRRCGWRRRRLPRTAAECPGRPLGWPSPWRAGPSGA